MSWSRKNSEDKNNESSSYPVTSLSSIVKVDLANKTNTVVTSMANSKNGARYGLISSIKSSRENEDEAVRMEKFKRLLTTNPIDLNELQKSCWKGIPKIYRHICWKLLSVT